MDGGVEGGPDGGIEEESNGRVRVDAGVDGIDGGAKGGVDFSGLD